MRLSVLAFLVLSVVAAERSSAQLFDSFGTVKLRRYSQASTLQPIVSDRYFYIHELADTSSLTQANVGAASVQTPAGQSIDMPTFVGPGSFVAFFSGRLRTEAELDAAVSGGSYEYSITGGAWGSRSGLHVQPQTNLWSNIPYVVNFDEVQHAAPGQPLTIQLNEYLGHPSTESFAFLNLFDQSDRVIASFGWVPDGREIIIDGSLIQPGAYQLRITYASDLFSSTSFFDGAFSIAKFQTSTSLEFTVTPAPSAAALLGLGGMFAARRRR